MPHVYKSKAIRLAEELLKDIWHNQYSRDQYLPPEETLAQRYCVSRITMRKVIAILVRDNVLEKIPNCGTRISPDLKLPEPETGESTSPIIIASVMAAFPDALTIEVNRGVTDYARQHGISYLLFQNTEGPEALFREIRQLKANQLSGLIWFGSAPSYNPEIRNLENNHLPLVCVDNPQRCVSAPYVGVDNTGGMYIAASELLETLRDGIFYLGAEPVLSSQQQRYGGYCQAMTDFGLRAKIAEFTEFYAPESTPRHWFESKNNRVVAKAAERILSGKAPMGIVTENDYIAQIVIETAAHMNMKAGRDFLLCGFDDLPLAQSLDLTTVRQPRYNLGYEAAQMLHHLIEHHDRAKINKLLPVSLVKRGSSHF